MKITQTVLVILLFTLLNFAQDKTKEPVNQIRIPEMGAQVKLPDNLPQTAEEYYDYAEKLWRRNFGRSEEARVLEYLDKAIELKPAFVDAFYFRGFVNNRVGRFQESLNDLSRCLELDANRLRAYELRAETKIKLKNFKGALEDYDEFILRVGTDGSFTIGSLKERARLRYFLGNYDGAIEDYTKALSRGSDSSLNFLRGAVFIKKGNNTEALNDLEKATDSLDYIFGESVKNYPDIYGERKGYPANEDPLASLNPNKVGTRVVTAGRASASATRVVEKPSDFPRPETVFPDLMEKIALDNWFDPNSNKHYSLLMLSDVSSVIYYHYGLLLIDQNRLKEAEDALTKSLAYDHEGYKNFDAWFRRGKLRLNDRKFESAVRDFSWAISGNRSIADAYLERGIAILMLGHDDLAESDFALYLGLNPEGNAVLETRKNAAMLLRKELQKKN